MPSFAGAYLLCLLAQPFAVHAVGLKAMAKSESQSSVVAKIIEMLGDMKGKVKADIAEETKTMEEFMSYCDNEASDKGYQIKTAKRTLEDLEATIEESTANVLELTDEISTLGTEIASKERELAEATKLRESERSVFETTEAELSESYDSISRAVMAVKKGQASFLQSASGKQELRQDKKLATVLSRVVESALLTGHQKRSLKSFLQTSEGDRDDAELSLSRAESKGAQPQPKAYTSGTSGVLDILEETKDKAETELGDCRKAEMEANHKFQLLQKGLDNEIAGKKKKLGDATDEKAENEQAKGKAEKEKIATTRAKTADSEYLSTLRADCQGKAVEWEERLKSAKGEIDAIDKATEILSSGVKVLIQTSASRRTVMSRHMVRMETDDEDDDSDSSDSLQEQVRQKVVHRLQLLQKTYRSYALAQLTSRAKNDPMAKIKGLIEEMIAKLVEELNEQVGQKAFCDEEMGKSKKAQTDKTMKMDKYKARLDEATTTKMELVTSIRELEAEVAEIDGATAEATKIRNEEQAEFVKAQTDYKNAEDACAQAAEVLRQYYEGTALIQLRTSTRVRSKAELDSEELGSAKVSSPGAGSTIISFLETAESDFARLLAEVEQAEDSQVEAFNKLSTESKVSKASKMAEIKAGRSEVKRLTSSIHDTADDHSSVQKELDAINMYMEKLKPQCVSKGMSAEEKIAARKAEIDGLKEALSILKGENI